MKRTFHLVALVAICSAMMVSCKNAKTTELTLEEVEAQKFELADSVLAVIDNLAAQYQEISNSTDVYSIINLTDEQKMVKPDYLLDPSRVEEFLTKEQKTNALAFYTIDIFVRQLYDMPTDEANAAIAKLMTELNRPLDMSIITNDQKPSEKLVAQYNAMKERGEINYFWKFQYAVLLETEYILSQNPDLFLANYTEEINQASIKQWEYLRTALNNLSNYDEEIKMIWDSWVPVVENMSEEEFVSSVATVEKLKETYKSDTFHYEEMRNALLK